MHRRLQTSVLVAAGFVLGVAFSVGTREFGTFSHAEVSAAPADPPPTEDVLPAPATPSNPTTRQTPVVEAVARTAPAVVSINTEVPNQSPFLAFYSGSETTTSQGSGAVIREDGVVLTNAHVVAGAVSITATFADQTSYPAQVLGLDESLDLAVLKLEGARGLPTIPLGTSTDLLLGEPVIAIGNPFGLGHTVTTGVVSSASRTLEVADRVFQDYIQTDAGINPGNSGGPLLNIRGELIGINSAIRRDAENIGFAIPVDRAAKVARDLLRYGSVRSPWLGVVVEDVGGPRYRGTPIAEGAILITRVDADAATQAGLQVGDVVLKVDGRLIHSRDDLNLHLATRKPGDRVRVEGLRKNQPFQVDLAADSVPDEITGWVLSKRLGIEVSPLDATLAQTFKVRATSGLIVTKAFPNGTFAAARLRAGDAILAVHGTPIKTVEDLRTALTRAVTAHRSTVLLTVQRGQFRGHVEVKL